MKVFFAFFFGLAIVYSAHGATSCENATTQGAMNECAAQSYRNADAELNRAYKTLTSQMKNDKESVRKLVVAQRAWIAFRDSECDLQSTQAKGGSVQGMVLNMCLEEQTRARTKMLDAYMNCQEGDVSCRARTR